MDINDLRVIATVLSFFVFIGIMVWAYSRRNTASFDEAAQLPFHHEDKLPAQQNTEETK